MSLTLLPPEPLRADESPPATGGLAGVFAAHRAQLKRAAQQILGDAHGADDVVHDAYLKAMEAGDGDVDAAVRQPLAYAHQIVRHMAIDRHRRAALESRLFDEADSGAHVASPGTGTPEALAIDRQQLSLVARALAQLPERVRRVFELYRIEGRTQRDIAVMFGISPTMVNFLVRDALDHCRRAIQRRP